jgi:hypothetical protein
MKTKTFLISAGIMLALANQSLFGIITGGAVTTGGGSFNDISGYAGSVGQNNFDTLNLYGFNEDQNVMVTGGNLVPDVGSMIPDQTIVASHYIFFDPTGNTQIFQEGYVTFDAKIIGVITSTALLTATDYLANNLVTYLSPTFRGLENGDTAVIDAGNDKKLNLSWFASNPGDYVRVLTEYSPGAVPDTGATALLLGLGLAALGFTRRLKK